jgi:hypothetical protein
MNWSAYIKDLNRKGYTNQQIMEECNMSFITEQFIINTLRKPSTYGWANSTGHPFTPRTATTKKIQAYFTTHPIEEIYTISSTILGERIGVSSGAIRHYKTKNIRGCIKLPDYLKNFRSYEKRLIHEGRIKSPEKQKTIQDIKNLW